MVGFLGLEADLKETGTPGSVRLQGTLTEEDMAGKVKLLDVDAYKDVDMCLMGHPGPSDRHGEGNTGTTGYRIVARTALIADVYGKPTHSAVNP
jgi:metal-dependent amidase/aminoacylase/carboxypeptidase family protein